MSIPDDDGQPHAGQAGEVVDIIPDIGDLLHADSHVAGDAFQLPTFILATLNAPNPQFAAAGRDDGIRFRRENDGFNSAFSKPAQPDPVAAPAPDGFRAILKDVDHIIREDAIEVKNDQTDGFQDFQRDPARFPYPATGAGRDLSLPHG
jgi:hypothetical protein